VSNPYCVVFLLLCFRPVASFSGSSISVFSNVYIANDIALSINTYAYWNLNKTKFYFKFSVLHF
jgi:hypothetical protein